MQIYGIVPYSAYNYRVLGVVDYFFGAYCFYFLFLSEVVVAANRYTAILRAFQHHSVSHFSTGCCAFVHALDLERDASTYAVHCIIHRARHAGFSTTVLRHSTGASRSWIFANQRRASRK